MDNAAFLVALVAVGVMGFANQRGGICTVAAIEEIVETRRFGRLLALFEASLWVAGGLILLSAFGVLPRMPEGYSAGLATIVGGALFGMGAVVNRACIFGSVARLGSGEWAYLATPAGYYIGSLVARLLPGPDQLSDNALLLSGPAWLAVLAGAALIARTFSHARRIRKRKEKVLEAIWSPHLATMLIGQTFLISLLAVGAWTYSELLRDLARGAAEGGGGKILLNVVLLGGAVLGGWTAGKLRLVSPDLMSLARTFVGGALMGVGGGLIPGGNTGLVLIGIPLLWPYAWLAFATICGTIYVAARLSRP